mgnify:CR=1 FL=1
MGRSCSCMHRACHPLRTCINRPPLHDSLQTCPHALHLALLSLDGTAPRHTCTLHSTHTARQRSCRQKPPLAPTPPPTPHRPLPTAHSPPPAHCNLPPTAAALPCSTFRHCCVAGKEATYEAAVSAARAGLPFALVLGTGGTEGAALQLARHYHREFLKAQQVCAVPWRTAVVLAFVEWGQRGRCRLCHCWCQQSRREWAAQGTPRNGVAAQVLPRGRAVPGFCRTHPAPARHSQRLQAAAGELPHEPLGTAPAGTLPPLLLVAHPYSNSLPSALEVGGVPFPVELTLHLL